MKATKKVNNADEPKVKAIQHKSIVNKEFNYKGDTYKVGDTFTTKDKFTHEQFITNKLTR